MDLKTQIEQFFNDLKAIMQILAPICAFIGLVGSDVIYMRSSCPVVGRLKRNNPESQKTERLGKVRSETQLQPSKTRVVKSS